MFLCPWSFPSGNFGRGRIDSNSQSKKIGNPLHTGEKACNKGQTSTELQNRSTSGPTKKTDVLQKNLRKRELRY